MDSAISATAVTDRCIKWSTQPCSLHRQTLAVVGRCSDRNVLCRTGVFNILLPRDPRPSKPAAHVFFPHIWISNFLWFGHQWIWSCQPALLQPSRCGWRRAFIWSTYSLCTPWVFEDPWLTKFLSVLSQFSWLLCLQFGQLAQEGFLNSKSSWRVWVPPWIRQAWPLCTVDWQLEPGAECLVLLYSRSVAAVCVILT